MIKEAVINEDHALESFALKRKSELMNLKDINGKRIKVINVDVNASVDRVTGSKICIDGKITYEELY
jgi:hypothetical protein